MSCDVVSFLVTHMKEKDHGKNVKVDFPVSETAYFHDKFVSNRVVHLSFDLSLKTLRVSGTLISSSSEVSMNFIEFQGHRSVRKTDETEIRISLTRSYLIGSFRLCAIVTHTHTHTCRYERGHYDLRNFNVYLKEIIDTFPALTKTLMLALWETLHGEHPLTRLYTFRPCSR